MDDTFGIPTLTELQQYNVNRPDQIEAIKASLYDSATYLQAGQQQLSFFQTPKGGTSGKTLADTNMTGAGSLPAPISFLVQSIEVYFFPGNVASATGAITADNWNDVYKVAKSGWLELFIGSKPYLDEAPLLKFPPKQGLSGVGALSDTTTAAVSRVTKIDYATFAGEPYDMRPPILLVPTQNFELTLNWPAVVPVSVAGRVVVNLGGILYRNSQ